MLKYLILMFFLSQSALAFESDKVVFINGPLYPTSSIYYIAQVAETSKTPGPRLVVINSPGGYVDEGSYIIASIEAEKAIGTQIICKVEGTAQSMAFNILSHCDVRIATKKSTFMFHHIYYGAWDPSVRINAKNLRKAIKDLESTDAPYTTLNRRLLHMTDKEYDKAANKDRVWTAQELFKTGYLTEIVDE